MLEDLLLVLLKELCMRSHMLILMNFKVHFIIIGIDNIEDFAILLYKEQNIMALPGSLFVSGDFLRFVLCADIPIVDELC